MKTPTTKEIIEVMKSAYEALEKYNEALRLTHVDFNDEEERDLESWSGNLRSAAGTLNNRILYK